MRRGLSVRWRLTLVYSLISVVSAAVLLGGIYALVSHPPESVYYVGSSSQAPTDILTGAPPPGASSGQIFQAALTPSTRPSTGCCGGRSWGCC